MRVGILLVLVALASAAHSQTSVATDTPVNGVTVEIARLTAGGTYCRAPLGPTTYFGLDAANQLIVVQPTFQRAARLNKSDILAYLAAQKDDLDRVLANNKKLAVSPAVDPRIRMALAGNTAAPSPHIARRLLRASSRPSAGASAQPRLAALEGALATARQEISNAGLSNTVLWMVTTCAADISRLPVTVTNSLGREQRTLTIQPLDAARATALDRYTIVPLYELMEGMGVPATMQPPP